jgi:hypothetical protein
VYKDNETLTAPTSDGGTDAFHLKLPAEAAKERGCQGPIYTRPIGEEHGLRRGLEGVPRTNRGLVHVAVYLFICRTAACFVSRLSRKQYGRDRRAS